MRTSLLSFSLFVTFGCLFACSGNVAPSTRKVATTDSAPIQAEVLSGNQVGQSNTDIDGKEDVAGSAPWVLDPSLIQPILQDKYAKAAAAAFRAKDWASVVVQSRKAVAGSESTPQTNAVELLWGLALAKQNQWRQSAEYLQKAHKNFPTLTDYISYQAARSLYFTRDYAGAKMYLSQVSKDSIVSDDARLLLGDIYRAEGKEVKGIVRHYQQYVDERPKGVRWQEALFRLGQAKLQLAKASTAASKVQLRKQGMADLRALTYRAPLSSWSKQATEKLDAISKDRSPATAQELITRGKVYYWAMRNPLSEADFRNARQKKLSPLSGDDDCYAAYHHANSIYKQRDRKRSAPLFVSAWQACQGPSKGSGKGSGKGAGQTDYRVKSAYQAGRSFAYLGKYEEAIRWYRKAETADSSHSYCDDARLRQAEAFTRLKDEKTVTKLLSSIPEEYPKGDMRAEAMWRLGFRSYKAGNLSAAIGYWQKQIQTMPIERNYWAEGQAQYWIGRAYGKLGKVELSTASYVEAIRTYPLSYYAMLGLNRLRETNATRWKQILAEIQTVRHPGDATFPLQDTSVRNSPRFDRALLYLRLGLGWPARAELAKLGLSPPKNKKAITDAKTLEKLWAMAYLYHHAGRFSESHWVTRWHVEDFKRHWPEGKWRTKWDIAYPTPYWDLIATHAEKNSFAPEILMAIMREESAFTPTLESYANAIGLTQMIFPTARRFAKGTGIKVTRKNLQNPEKNVTIGSRFLGFLHRKWDHFILLIPPSYNAGEGAVTRWLRARGELAADEWIESIGIDQARRYSKRVLSSYFVYSYLRNRTVPIVGNTIPKALLPRRR